MRRQCGRDAQGPRQGLDIEAFVGFEGGAIGVQPERDRGAIVPQAGGHRTGVQSARHLRRQRAAQAGEASDGFIDSRGQGLDRRVHGPAPRQASPGELNRLPDGSGGGAEGDRLDRPRRDRNGAVQQQAVGRNERIQHRRRQPVDPDSPAGVQTGDQPVRSAGRGQKQSVLLPGDTVQSAGGIAQKRADTAVDAELDADVASPEPGHEFSLVRQGIIVPGGWKVGPATIEDVADQGPRSNRKAGGQAGARQADPGRVAEIDDGPSLRLAQPTHIPGQGCR